MRIRCSHLAAALVALGAAWLGAPPSHALSSPPMNVADLVRHSSAIVVGTVSDVTQSAQPGQPPYTEIQVKVAETISGPRAQNGTLTFRQFGLQSPLPAADGRKFVGSFPGMPTYRTGDQVVLFLGPVSSIGLRTTAGLTQGKFVARAGNLENEVNNRGLFQNVSFTGRSLGEKEQAMVETKEGAVSGDTFLGLVRRAVNEHWFDITQLPSPKPPKYKPVAPASPKKGTLPTEVGR
jgi:hypothetical protein